MQAGSSTIFAEISPICKDINCAEMVDIGICTIERIETVTSMHNGIRTQISEDYKAIRLERDQKLVRTGYKYLSAPP